MLAFLGLDTVDDLFAAVPTALRVAGGLSLAHGRPEPDVLVHLDELAAANDRLVCFAGAGAYDHEIPPVVPALAGRSEFVTSYTPYQPEVAQGVLQAIFEFQTMVARLAGLPVANASLYDGASRAGRGRQPRRRRGPAPDGVGVGRRPSALAGRPGHVRRRDRPPPRRRAARRRADGLAGQSGRAGRV